MSKTLLIVEDEAAIRFALKFELGDSDYQILTAEDIPQARATIVAEKPDLIILDVMFPDGANEGFDFCKELKADESTKDIPVIILTARPEKDRSEGADAGADRYFTKPPDISALRVAIEELL
jgi:two-component system, OmpR family, phosphate regulon response regulator PhoB